MRTDALEGLQVLVVHADDDLPIWLCFALCFVAQEVDFSGAWDSVKVRGVRGSVALWDWHSKAGSVVRSPSECQQKGGSFDCDLMISRVANCHHCTSRCYLFVSTRMADLRQNQKV